MIGEKRAKRLVGEFRDSSGSIELIWFQGISWIQKALQEGNEYLVYGKLSFFQGNQQITHPEIELLNRNITEDKFILEPVYPSTEKLKSKGLGGRQIGKLTRHLFTLISEKDIPEILPEKIVQQLKLYSRFRAFSAIHFPENPDANTAALNRLKFEELFIAQLRTGMIKSQRHRYSKGLLFNQVGNLFNTFYSTFLPFELTGAQKKVLKEIRKDTEIGRAHV